jgi:hypothetical protein
MRPRTDAELLPVPLDLIDAAVPVSQWPSKMTKARRATDRSTPASTRDTA